MADTARLAAGSGNDGLHLAPDAGPLIGMRITASRHLWRLGPAWAVVAGALASGASLAGGETLLRLVGIVILADSAWGAAWAPLAGLWTHDGAARPADRGSSWPLPYLQPASPADMLRDMVPGGRWHEVLAGAVLSGGLGALLGGPALIISLLAMAAALAVLFFSQFGRRAAFLYALLEVGLPWALGMTLAGTGSLEGMRVTGAVLGVAFMLLDWGAQRARGPGRSRARGVWMGQVLVLAVLVALRLPWTTAVVAALFLPPTLFWLRAVAPAGAGAERFTAAPGIGDAVARSGPWWWAALLLAALAMR